MTKRKCGCVYADRFNTSAVRKGFEMGGYLRSPCANHSKQKTPARQPEDKR